MLSSPFSLSHSKKPFGPGQNNPHLRIVGPQCEVQFLEDNAVLKGKVLIKFDEIRMQPWLSVRFRNHDGHAIGFNFYFINSGKRSDLLVSVFERWGEDLLEKGPQLLPR